MPERPSLEFYTVEVQRPDGDAWTTVHTERAATGRSAIHAAGDVLRYCWPVSIYDKGDDRLSRRWDGLAAVARWRMVVTPASHNQRGDSATATIGELATYAIRRAVEERRAAREALKDVRAKYVAARTALRGAQATERVAGYRIEDAEREALHIGADPADVAKAKRLRKALP